MNKNQLKKKKVFLISFASFSLLNVPRSTQANISFKGASSPAYNVFKCGTQKKKDSL